MHCAPRLARSGFTTIGLWVAALLCTPAAHAQVNKCRIDGQLVYRSTPCPLEPRAVAAQAPITGAPVVSKKKTLADVLRERDAADPQRLTAPDAQGDGANVLRSRMGAG